MRPSTRPTRGPLPQRGSGTVASRGSASEVETEQQQQQTLRLFQEPVGVTTDRRNTWEARRICGNKPPTPGPIYEAFSHFRHV